MRSENYNAGASDHLHIQNISLKSQPAPLRTSHAVGIFTKSGELHLVPVNNAVQLRPSLQHLDKADVRALALAAILIPGAVQPRRPSLQHMDARACGHELSHAFHSGPVQI